MHRSGTSEDLNRNKRPFRIDNNNPEFSKSFESLTKKIRHEVMRVQEEILSVDPFPQPNSRLIVRLRGRYKDIYRIVVANKYRYIYRVEGTTIHSWYVGPRTNETYVDIP